MGWITRICRPVVLLGLIAASAFGLGQKYGVTDVYDFPNYYEQLTPPLEVADGSFYGLAGIVNEAGGYVYKLAPLGDATTIYTFPNTELINPNSLILATDGNLYGTEEYGGTNGGTVPGSGGVLFKITPAGVYTALYNFPTYGGSNPRGIVQGNDGKLYGTTGPGGGEPATFFSFDLTSNTYTQLYSFQYVAPLPPLVQGTDGYFYGVAPYGGEGQSSVIFKISATGVYKPLYTLPDQQSYQAFSSLVEGPDGYFYGWVSEQYGLGVTAIYKINSSGVGEVVHEFPTGATPSSDINPTPPLTVGSDGKIYGEYFTEDPDTEGNQPQLYLFSLTTAGQYQEITNLKGFTAYSAFTQGSDGAFYFSGGSGLARLGNVWGTPGILAAPVKISLTPAVVSPGESATLAWSVTNAFGQSANLCFASGSWSGVQASSGSKTITAGAAGDYGYGLTCGGVESGSATLIVGSNREASSTTVVSTPSTVTVGGSITAMATVNSSSGSGPAATGNVTFTSKGVPLFTVPLSGGVASATFPTTAMPPGKFSISATYNGDSNYEPSSTTTATVVQVQGNPVVKVTATPNPVGQNLPLTLSAAVGAVNGGPVPTGNVYFVVGQTETIGAYPVKNGTATVTSKLGTQLLGSYSATATYNGDANYLASTYDSNSIEVVPDVAVTVTASPNPVIEGQSVTLFAVAASTGFQPTPTGTMTFSIPGLVIGTAKMTNGSAALTASSATVAPGIYAVTATYNGDGYNGPATSAAVNVKVTAP